ncbi:unnamed protein product, partial [Nippostrongylus brasiliensis]|uniref:t-SNARE coiled-coil homology domain-containing protein n=1 Tax=Nippostrongylus brasiliensis TaxID=27835 RepID=A0A0N4XQP3_NIPBR
QIFHCTSTIYFKIERVSQQLQSGIAQILAERGNLEPDEQERFDARTEPIRKQIQSTLHATNSLPPLKSKNPFLDEDSDDVNPYVQESDLRALELKAKAEEARMTAEATAKLNKDMQDLEEIFAELAAIVHEQHEVVDSIEEHIERATHDIRHGNEQLKKAVRSKTNHVSGLCGWFVLISGDLEPIFLSIWGFYKPQTLSPPIFLPISSSGHTIIPYMSRHILVFD